MKKEKISGLKMASAILETILALPVIGAMLIIGCFWLPLAITLILHITTLIITKQNKKQTGSILGIITSCIGWIPFVGWILHILSAIFLWVETFKGMEK